MLVSVEEYLKLTHIAMDERHIAELKVIALRKLERSIEFKFNELDELVRMYYIPDRGFMAHDLYRTSGV